MKLLTLIILLFTINSSFAAKVEDVIFLDVKQGSDSFMVKFQIKNGEKDSFFTVDITKNDPKAFEKIAYILRKLKKENFKLDLNIPSFSAKPSGSYYKSDGVKFSSSTKLK